MKTNVTGTPVAEKSFFTASLLRVLAILLILTICLLSSCSNTPEQGGIVQDKVTPPGTTTPHDFSYEYTEDNTDVSLSTPYSSIPANSTLFTDAVKPQDFIVKNKKDTTIEGKKGIKVLIPKNCFDLPNPNAEVKIELKEYTTAEDFFFANLTTGSNGKLLESGGTVYIIATSEGKNVSLKKGQKISLAFPTGKAKPKPGMQTFYGEKKEDGTINWQPTVYTARTVSKDFDKNAKVVRWKSKETSRIKLGQKVSLLTGWKFQVQAYGSNNHCTRFTDSTDYKNVLEYFQDNYTISPEDSKYLKGSYFVFTYKYNYQGNIEDVQVGLEHHPKKYFNKRKQLDAITHVKNNAINAIKNMPKGEPTKYMGREVVRLYFNNFSQYKDVGPELKINDNKVKRNITETIFYPDSMSLAKYLEWSDSIAKVAKVRHDSLMTNDADYYMMNTGKLGWINCDRFYNNGKPKGQVIAMVDAPGNVTVKLIFKDILSVMNMVNYSTGGFRAYDIPAGENVKVMVVDKRKDGTYYAIKEGVTGEGTITDFEFKPMTVEAIKKELASL